MAPTAGVSDSRKRVSKRWRSGWLSVPQPTVLGPWVNSATKGAGSLVGDVGKGWGRGLAHLGAHGVQHRRLAGNGALPVIQ